MISDGPGGGEAWLQEHLLSNYMPGTVRELANGDTDAAVVTDGLSRWDNYYLEGLAWLLESVRIDGALSGRSRIRPRGDENAFARSWMQHPASIGRRRGSRDGRIGEDHRPALKLDRRRTADQPGLQYMDIMPFVNSFRFDGARPDEQQDYWLVELSGIPFRPYRRCAERHVEPVEMPCSMEWPLVRTAPRVPHRSGRVWDGSASNAK